MGRNVNQLKNEARRAEQREDWSRAIELYREAIQASRDAGDVSPDLSLYNRIGDLFRRRDEADRAVQYYMQAVDKYTEQGLHTGAIALCNKILRIAPDQVEVYRNLGRLHAATGLVAEARNSFREYASRMEERGDEVARLEALAELAGLTQDEELLEEAAEGLAEEGEKELAASTLRELWDRRVSEGEEASDLRGRILELDPRQEFPEEEPEEAEEEEGHPEPAASAGQGASDDSPETGGAGRPAPAVEEEPAPDLDDMLLELDAAEEEATRSDEPEDPAGSEEEEEDVEVALRYAEVLERSGQDAAAIEQLESVLDRLEREGDPVRAADVVDRLLGLDPDRVVFLRKRAELARHSGDESDAVEAYLALARSLGGASSREALRAYAQVLDIDPENDEAREALEGRDGPPGDGSEELDDLWSEESSASRGAEAEEAASGETGAGDLDEVLEELSEVAGETDATGGRAPAEPVAEEADAEGYADLGAAIRSRVVDADAGEAVAGFPAGRPDFDGMLVGFRAEASETMGEADPAAHVELGVALRQMGLLDDAIREFQVAARGPEPPVRAYELLGEAFIEKGLHSVAIRVLTRALRLPGYTDFDLLGILYQLGVAHSEEGEAEQARDCFERVYSVDIDFRDVAERLESLVL